MNVKLEDGTPVKCKRRGLKIVLSAGAKKGEGLMRRIDVSATVGPAEGDCASRVDCMQGSFQRHMDGFAVSQEEVSVKAGHFTRTLPLRTNDVFFLVLTPAK
jgi:hypothetical protein